MPDKESGMSEEGGAAPPVPHSATIRYVPGLDGLRGIAVLAVLLHHSGIPGFRGGFVGVDVFFVISGYLITRILFRRAERESRVPFRHFYIRRARRILPALWTMFVLLTLVFLVDPTFSSPDEYLHSLAIAAVFLTQWQLAMNDLPGPFIHLWSLGWEENFYLVWPVLFAIVRKRSKPVLSALLIAGIVGLNVTRLMYSFDAYDGPWVFWVAAYYRVDAIMLGCLLGLVLRDGRTQSPRSARWEPRLTFVALAILGLTFTVEDERFFWIAGFTAVSFATAYMVSHLGRRGGSRLAGLLETPFLRWTGLISYGLYLWHYPVFHWMRQHGLEPAVILVVGGPVAIGLAALSYYTVEARFRNAT